MALEVGKMETGRPVVVGVDGGGTNTRALVADRSGTVLGEGHAGPSNYRAVGLPTASANLRTAILAGLKAAGAAPEQVAAAVAGLAGAGRPEDQAVMRAELAFLSQARLEVVADGRIALAGALGGEPGVLVIAGTGSVAFGVDQTGQTLRAGGWGYLLGDEGSGYDVGRQAIKAALAALDGTGQETDLGRRICRQWGLERLDQVIGRVYGDPVAAKGEIGALAPLVVQAAEAGDGVALGILRQAGQELGRLVCALFQRLGLRERPRYSGVGGLFTASAALREAMQAYVQERFPASEYLPARETPAQGAVRMALALLGPGAM